MNLKSTKFYLVRHGKCAGNLEQVWGGDSHLTSDGQKTILKLKKQLQNIKFDVVYASNLHRAIESAQILSKKKVVIEPDLRERHYGLIEGKSNSEISPQISNILEFNWQDVGSTKAETNEAAYLRFKNFLLKTANHHLGHTILAVTHENLLRCLLVKLKNLNLDEFPHETIKNGDYMVVESDGQNLSMVSEVF